MDLLTQRLRDLGISRTPSVDELTTLVVKHHQRKERGKQLAQHKGPISNEQKAVLLFAKNNKQALDVYKQQLGGRAVHSTRYINGQPITSTKYVVPDNQKQNYSAWLRQQANNPAVLQQVQNQALTNSKLYAIKVEMQSQAHPRYLTAYMQTYVKRMFAAGQSEAEVKAWLVSLGDKVPFGILDMNTGKLKEKNQRGSFIPPPPGIAAIPPRPSKKR